VRLYRYRAGIRRHFRLILNRYPGEFPIGIAVHRGVRIWSLVWRGPAALSAKKWAMRDAAEPALNDGGDGDAD
jgi:hypothetical protein